jgi:hypothetical protein
MASLDGIYIGLAEGDVSPTVTQFKDFVRNKWNRFDATVGEGPVFTHALTGIVAELQDIYRSEGKLKPGEYIPGVINKKTKIATGFLQDDPPVDTRPLLFTFCGAGVPGWVGPDADTGRALESIYLWRWVGFDSKPVPMGPGIKMARDQFYIDANIWRDHIEKYGYSFCAYSMGSIACSEVWEFDIKPVNGRLHWMFPHFIGAAMIGPPMREVGNAIGDANGAAPPKDSGGVTEVLMKDTPATWINIAHAQDLYVNIAGQSGEDKRAIFQVIRNASIGSVFKGADSIASQVFEIMGIKKDASRIAEIYGLFRAMWDAGMFFGKGLTPHTNYLPSTAIEHLRTVLANRR